MGKQRVVEILNEDRMYELGAIMQYMAHHYLAAGMESTPIIENFKKSAIDEMKHAEALAERIAFLGGVPTEKRAPIKTKGDLKTMIRDNLKTEYEAIERYKKHVAILEVERDTTSRRLLEEILEEEEDHANTWETLLNTKK